ncbi:hypothetical protein [Allokutzneria oryzae]|uniref:Uncharacterized protein n=1 Tax=Allokutzneria oryzae TaxID=1378989 RepID=A0ABV5ZTH4_9PSEU
MTDHRWSSRINAAPEESNTSSGSGRPAISACSLGRNTRRTMPR